MNKKHWLALIAALAVLLLAAHLTRATAYHTITVDGDMGDWAADEDMEASGPYTLYLTWDANNIYLGLTGAYLGDDPVQDKSFFACFDTTPGIGAPSDGYGNVLFDTNRFAPEYCYYFAGGAGWYEWSVWDGVSWQWPGWRNDGTYYNWPGNPAPLPGSELTIQRSDIGNPGAVRVVAWLTPEQPIPGTVEAAWPTSNPIGPQPTLADSYFYPDLSYDGVSPDIAVGAQGDHVVINEFVAKGTEWVELYNPTSSSVDISGWRLTSDYGGLNYTIPGGTVLPPGGYYVYSTLGNLLHNDGDLIRLADSTGILVDVVGYGIRGAAPLPPQYWGAARVPNGQDTDDDARDWNLDETETQGTVNDAPPVDLGSSLILNEFDNYPPASGNDKVEIYNPTSTTITMTNWLLSDGDAVAPIVTAVSVPPGGWLVLEETVDWTADMDFASADVGYLFRPDGTRVDQIGWYNEYEDNTFQRICDGAGPNDGYDWSSSGGGVTWFDLPQTLGGTNTPGPVDVKVDKSGPSSVLPGGLITYVVTYQAVQPIPATALVLTDTLPDNVVYLGYTAVPTITLLGTDPLVWDAGSRCGYANGVLTITAQVSGTVLPGTVLTNTVEITATDDVNLANNTAVVTTVVGSDVGIAKSCPADPFLPGQVFTYTIAYTVTGEPAQSLVLTDVLPVGVTYLSDSSGITPTQPTTGTLVWAMGTVTDSGSFLITATVSTDPMTWTFTNRAWITATNDSVAANNYAACSNQGPVPIREIQYVPDPATNDASPYVGQLVWVEGVVIAGSDVFLSDSGTEIRYYIEDPDGGPWSGLYVYKGSSLPSVREGDRVLLHGRVTEYQGVTELDLTGAGGVQVILSSGNPLPSPQVLSTGTYTPTGAVTAEAYESVLIEFRSAVVTNDNLGFGEWAFDDGSGEAHADDWSHYLTYVPALGDLYSFIRGIGNYNYGEYKIEPRYDADIDLDYPTTFVYHDLEDVVQSGEAVYLAGDFNGWSTTATPMTANDDYSVFSVTVTLPSTGTYEYKYIVYTDTVPSGPANWNWLQSQNRSVEVTAPGTVNDYRDIRPGYVVLQWPPAVTTTVGIPTENIYGRIWADDLTSREGPPRAVLAQVGYGTDPNPANWTTWSPMVWNTQSGNNDEFMGVLTPTAAGVYSYVVRFNGNWGTGNPNNQWYYGDTDGVYPGDPFEIEKAGVLTVLAPSLTLTKAVSPQTGVPLGGVVVYTVTLSNGGEGLAGGIVLTDALPAEVAFGGWVQGSGVVHESGVITWTGNLAGGVSVTLVFTATVGTDLSLYNRTVTNTASYRSDNAGRGSAEAAFTTERRYYIYMPLVMKNYRP